MAVKKYSYKKDKDVYCSPHTQVKEMASISGSKLYGDVVLVDETLMEMVEKLFKKMQCKKYVISSGYRTAAHDKAVGGNGTGQHTKGRAIDACFYDKNNKIIPAQIVCCVAQDLGFKGIANISAKYRYVHLDMRTSGTYKGDEIKGYSTVTTNFYEYFGKTKDDVAKYTSKTETSSSTVLVWQKAAIADGFKFPKYGANGEWNSECESVAKQAICKKRITYKYKNLTKIVQKAVGVAADGLFGANTKKAVIAYQKKKGLTADGAIGYDTWKKILEV